MARLRNRRGQSFVEYAVLVSAAILATVLVAGLAHRAFVGQAQDIEQNAMVF